MRWQDYKCNSFGLFKIKTFIYFITYFFAMVGLHCCMQAFPNCGEQGLLQFQCEGFSLWWPLLFQTLGMWALVVSVCGLSSCGSRAQDSVIVDTGSATLQQVGSSWTRDRTSVPCIARQILNHRTTREAPF